MKQIFIILFLISFLIFGGNNTFSQVTIGSNTPPQPYAILEIVSGNGIFGGLRIPQIRDNVERQLIEDKFSVNLELAKGLLIFNHNVQSLQYWDGNKWVTVNGENSIEVANGLSLYGDTIKLGGILINDVIINAYDNTKMMSIRGNKTNFFNITNTAATNTILSVDAANNQVGIGTANPNAPLEVVNNSSGTIADFYGNTSISGSNNRSISIGGFRGSASSKTPVLSGDQLFLGFRGLYNISGSYTGMRAALGATATSNFTNQQYPSMALSFYTAAVGESTISERMRIDDKGNISITTAPIIDGNTSTLVRNNTTGQIGIAPQSNFEITLASGSTGTIDVLTLFSPGPAFLTISSNNNCGRVMNTIFSLIVDKDFSMPLSFINAMARQVVGVSTRNNNYNYKVTFSGVTGCSGDGGGTQFDFSIDTSTPGKITITNNGDATRKYTIKISKV